MIKKPDYNVGDYVCYKMLDTRQEIRCYIFEVAGKTIANELHLSSLNHDLYSGDTLASRVVQPYWLQKGDTFFYEYSDGKVENHTVEDLFFDASNCLIVMARSGDTFGLRHNDFGTFDNYKFELV